MKTITLYPTGKDPMVFQGQMLFQYNQNIHTRLTLYKLADTEAGEYLLYVVGAESSVAYVCAACPQET